MAVLISTTPILIPATAARTMDPVREFILTLTPERELELLQNRKIVTRFSFLVFDDYHKMMNVLVLTLYSNIVNNLLIIIIYVKSV